MVRLPSSCLRRGALTYITGIQGRHVLPNQARLPRWLRFQQQRCLHGEYEPEFDELYSESSSSPPPPPPFEPEAAAEPQQDTVETPARSPAWQAFHDSFQYYRATLPGQYLNRWQTGQEVVVHGFLGKRRDKGSGLSFCDLETSNYAMQIVSTWREEGSLQHAAHQRLRTIPAYSPVSVTGTLVESDRPVVKTEHTNSVNAKAWDLRLRSVQCLNPFPKDIIVSKDAVWSPAQRHLQLRFDPALRERLRMRGAIMAKMRNWLRGAGMEEVETPLLFKSTPEGAREFLVPTRRPGYAYALPQSPQQYKQILMASGLPGYFQFAKCFRDEDHRADRQPEFTQLDLEMPFATGLEVRGQIASMLNYVLKGLDADRRRDTAKAPLPRSRKRDEAPADLIDEDAFPVAEQHQSTLRALPPSIKFFTMSYDYTMRKFGTDKPDLRITPVHCSNIHRIEDFVPADFVSKITTLENPVVEAVLFHLNGTSSARESADFMRGFMEGTLGPGVPKPPARYASPGSSPAVLVCDHSKPLSGLAALGHEAAERLLAFEGKDWVRVADGDVLVIHARERVAGDDSYGGDIGVVDSANNGVSATDSANDSDSDSDSASDSNSDDIRIGGFGGFGITGGSTDLGRLRHAIYHAATKKGLMTHPRENSVLRAVWIYNFPLFTPRSAEDADPGQGGSAGFASTHHPFTAPLAATDLELLRTDPLRAKADHYDLVINGVEVGGGSRRIHVAEVQEFVLREVLRMGDAGVAQFAHLLGALRAGCPPHAGFAIGFDRLLTVLWDLPSVRDVMAFPKNNRGEDPLVASPSRTTAEQQRTYHLFRTETETETE